MNQQPTKSRGLYFEEFKIGKRITSAGRTITESDIVSFAGLSGDYNQIHTDAEYSKTTPYGKRIAHGLLVMSITSGLVNQSGLIEDTVIAFREISTWKFSKPVFIGDTIHVEIEATEKKPLRRLGGGAVKIALYVKNQENDVVMRGNWTVLIASLPTD